MSAAQMRDGASSRSAISRPATPARTAQALQAFEKGAFELVASELARCRSEDDPLTQLRIASDVEAVARATLGFGELLVRFELTPASAPAATLGQSLLDQLEPSLPRLRKRSRAPDDDTLDPARPPDPGAALEEIESFLASRVSPSAAFLRAPFGVEGPKLRLVEGNRHGYDIWWAGFFFAIPHGRSPRLAARLIQLLIWARGEVLPWIPRRLRVSHIGRAILGRLRSRWRSARPETAVRPPAVLRVPLLGLSATRTGLEMQQHIAEQLRRAPRAL